MSAIQNHKALWRKKRQCCDAKDVKRKPKTASHVKIAESKCRAKSYAENIKTNLSFIGQKLCRVYRPKVYRPKKKVCETAEFIGQKLCREY